MHNGRVATCVTVCCDDMHVGPCPEPYKTLKILKPVPKTLDTLNTLNTLHTLKPETPKSCKT
jgi:hypothetical protein